MSDTRKKRERVARACIPCRRKKVKCDGNVPCSHCVQSNSSLCTYPDPSQRPKTRKINKVNKNNSTIEALDTRLARLEGVLTNLASKIGGGGGGGVDGKHDILDSASSGGNRSPEYKDSSFASSNSDDDNSDDNASDGYEQATSSKGFPYRVVHRLIENPTEPNDEQASYQMYERFYGTHSLFHIFSEKSIEWILSKLPPKYSHLSVPAENMAFMFSLCVKSFTDIWFAPKAYNDEQKQKLEEGWFPEDEGLVYDLLNCWDKIFLVGYLITGNELKESFHGYYQKIRNNTKPKLKYSELLTMNISLSLCISAIIDGRMANECSPGSLTGRTPNLNFYSTDDLILMQTRFFSSSIYYYDKILVMSDGLKTIQAILLLIIYLETSWIKSSVDYILTSIAVRYAQEIGLHRFESFAGLSSEQALRRRCIWFVCEYLDMEVCYRLGKPPLLNHADVSTLTIRDMASDIDPNIVKGLFLEGLNADILKQVLHLKGPKIYSTQIINLLNQIRTKSYSTLFSASSSTSYSDTIKTLSELNNDMFKLRSSTDPAIRPRFYDDPDFGNELYSNVEVFGYSREMILTFQLTYFTHSLTINKLISQINTPEFKKDCPEFLAFKNIALESARTILHMCRRIDRNSVPISCINWVIYYPFGAFLTLLANCLNSPNSNDVVSDVNLLIDISVNFFAFNKNILSSSSKKGYSKVYNQRESVVLLVCGVMLHLGLRIVESKSDHNFIDNSPQLKTHLEDCCKVFPDLFRPRKKPFNKSTNSSNSTEYNGTGSGSGSGSGPGSGFGPGTRTGSCAASASMTNPTTTTDTSEFSISDSPFSFPQQLLPGPTGYLTIPSEIPKDFGSMFDSTQKTPSYSPGKTPLANLINPDTTNTPQFQESSQRTNFNINELEYNEALESILGVGTPNFFFDNSVG